MRGNSVFKGLRIKTEWQPSTVVYPGQWAWADATTGLWKKWIRSDPSGVCPYVPSHAGIWMFYSRARGLQQACTDRLMRPIIAQLYIWNLVVYWAYTIMSCSKRNLCLYFSWKRSVLTNRNSPKKSDGPDWPTATNDSSIESSCKILARPWNPG